MTKEGILRYDYEPFSLQKHFSQKMQVNLIMHGRCEFTSMWMHGALLLSLVYQHSLWVHKQFYRGEVVFPRTVYLEAWREGSQASRLADTMDKGNFHIIFKTQRFFMLDKCILKMKIHPMRSSGSHGICRIKVMMAAFLAIQHYTPSPNCKQDVNKIHAS